MSLPIWERGLKLMVNGNYIPITDVAPYMGAWIETQNMQTAVSWGVSRSLYGSVD